MNKNNRDFPGGPVVKNPSANAGDTGLILGLGRFRILQSNQALSPQLLKLMRPRACREATAMRSLYATTRVASTRHTRKSLSSNEDPEWPNK